MKTMLRVIALTGCCTAIGCTWSELHKSVYSSCMNTLLAYEADLVGPWGEVFPEGIDKSDYCWWEARERTRGPNRRGIIAVR